MAARTDGLKTDAMYQFRAILASLAQAGLQPLMALACGTPCTAQPPSTNRAQCQPVWPHASIYSETTSVIDTRPLSAA